MQLKRFLCLLLVFLLCLIQMQSKTNVQEGLSPLETLISDLQETHDLIEQGENKSAITILKNAQKIVREIKEFNAKTKSITLKRIKMSIIA